MTDVVNLVGDLRYIGGYESSAEEIITKVVQITFMVFSFNQFNTQYDNNYSIKVLRKIIEYSQLLSQFIVTLRQTKCKISMCIKTSKEKTKIILYCNKYVLISKIQNGLKLNTHHFMTFLHYK